MIIFFSISITLSLYGQKNSCVECHQGLEEALQAPVKALQPDIHSQFGLGCQDCHGGNPSKDDIELAKDKTFKGAPKRKQIPEFCGSCHADSQFIKKFNPNLRVDQMSLYWTSRHGQILKKGDDNAAVCTDCHGHHGIQPSNRPKSAIFPWNIPQTCGRCHADPGTMKAYKIPTNQVEEYKQSVHAKALFEKKDLSAPVCNDCHGNHGAVPPEVVSIAFVCRQCHLSNAELFAKSPHKKGFDELGLTECEACHGHHRIPTPTDALLGTGKESVCIQCHDPGSKGFEAAGQMSKELNNLIAEVQEAQGLLEKSERQGVEVSDPKFKLQEAVTSLVQARNLSHGLVLEAFKEKIGGGEKAASDVRQAGQSALKEAKFRRTGLAVVTIFLILLATAIFLKVRDIAKRSKA